MAQKTPLATDASDTAPWPSLVVGTPVMTGGGIQLLPKSGEGPVRLDNSENCPLSSVGAFRLVGQSNALKLLEVATPTSPTSTRAINAATFQTAE